MRERFLLLSDSAGHSISIPWQSREGAGTHKIASIGLSGHATTDLGAAKLFDTINHSLLLISKRDSRARYQSYSTSSGTGKATSQRPARATVHDLTVHASDAADRLLVQGQDDAKSLYLSESLVLRAVVDACSHLLHSQLAPSAVQAPLSSLPSPAAVVAPNFKADHYGRRSTWVVLARQKGSSIPVGMRWIRSLILMMVVA